VRPAALFPDLDTPSLVVDLDVVEANIAEMSAVARSHGVRLRPHTKTHKMPAMAHLQLAAGAAGITCAKLGEAEVMADAGCDDILIAYPIWGEEKLRRLRALRERARIRVSLDSVEIAEGLGRLGRETGSPVEILVEVDTGHHRLGLPPGRPTVDLVRRIAGIAGLDVIGLLTHGGHAYRSRTPEELAAAARREGADLVETAELCARDGIELREISVGSTPTARHVAGVTGVTEVRPGTYIFNDAAMMRLGVATEPAVAARVIATVVSRPGPDRFVVDAGTKCLSSDGVGTPDWIVAAGRPDVHFAFLTEDHGVGSFTPSGQAADDLAIGDRLAILPSHVCSVINLFDHAFGVRGGEVTETLDIAGRGKVR
jgi:D-serine deaminase-like pyridoxal phosphate-dependent protein